MQSFTEFVNAFSQFGSDMVELAHISGDRQNVCGAYILDFYSLTPNAIHNMSAAEGYGIWKKITFILELALSEGSYVITPVSWSVR